MSGNVNIVKADRFGLEALTVFLEAKRTLYAWWVGLGTLGGIDHIRRAVRGPRLHAVLFTVEINARSC